MRSANLLAVSAVATLAISSLAGCGSASPAHVSTHPPVLHARAPTQLPVSSVHRPSQPSVGATQAVHAGGTTLTVAVVRVIDPLLGSGAALLPDTRAVGVLVRISNNGPGIYDSSATGDISIVPSTGTTTPVFAARGVCQTPLRDFDNYITPGEARDGCVAFGIDSDAKLLAVRFSPHGATAGRAAWRVGS